MCIPAALTRPGNRSAPELACTCAQAQTSPKLHAPTGHAAANTPPSAWLPQQPHRDEGSTAAAQLAPQPQACVQHQRQLSQVCRLAAQSHTCCQQAHHPGRAIIHTYIHTSYELSMRASAVFVGASCPHWQRHHTCMHMQSATVLQLTLGGQRTTTVSISNLCDETLYVNPLCATTSHALNTARVGRSGTHPDHTRHAQVLAAGMHTGDTGRCRRLRTPNTLHRPPVADYVAPHVGMVAQHAWWRNTQAIKTYNHMPGPIHNKPQPWLYCIVSTSDHKRCQHP